MFSPIRNPYNPMGYPTQYPSIQRANNEPGMYNTICASNPSNWGNKNQDIAVNSSVSEIPKSQSSPHQISTSQAMKSMKALYEKKTFSDVTFVFDDKKLLAHKAVLAVRSEVFEAMFSSKMKEDTSSVEIFDTKAEIFEEFLKYLYIGEFNNLKNKDEEMLFLADKYQICELKKLCEDYMLINICENNVVKYLLVADKYCCVALKKKALDTLEKSAGALKRAIMSGNTATLMILKEVFDKNCSLTKE
ncbi:speckle-type POZ protein-like [Venturia canescens]|uniref:speckle-type POZ protein-like n=1 Tax=Venturia canescens TaxID=32260 RepID=UPI001C9BF965|nr:speckle-type POZ protein-like [Venturia canescens]